MKTLVYVQTLLIILKFISIILEREIMSWFLVFSPTLFYLSGILVLIFAIMYLTLWGLVLKL